VERDASVIRDKVVGFKSSTYMRDVRIEFIDSTLKTLKSFQLKGIEAAHRVLSS
jgi:hypothetical protein